jgi:hypothetical protein
VLLSLCKNIYEITSLLLICFITLVKEPHTEVKREHTVSGKEGDGSSLLPSTTCTTNTMDIILRIVRVVIVEHMGNVSNIFIMG